VVPATLYDRIRDRLDLANSGYLGDLEIGQACEEAYLDLWDFLIDRLGDEGPWERQNLVTVPNQDFVDMPVASNVYRLLRLEFPAPSSICYEPVRSLNLTSDEISGQAINFVNARSFRYFARRSSRASLAARTAVAGGFAAWRFYFSPVPSAAYTLRVYYVPPPAITFNTSNGDYASFPDEFPEYVVADVCAKMMDKQEGDSAPFVTERERIKSRIERYAKPHQMNGPRRIADMRRLDTGDTEMDVWRRRR
jgi:hypothetical protein